MVSKNHFNAMCVPYVSFHHIVLYIHRLLRQPWWSSLLTSLITSLEMAWLNYSTKSVLFPCLFSYVTQHGALMFGLCVCVCVCVCVVQPCFSFPSQTSTETFITIAGYIDDFIEDLANGVRHTCWYLAFVTNKLFVCFHSLSITKNPL